MIAIDIYTTPFCPYCGWAKDLLNRKNVVFNEIDVSNDVGLRGKMTERAGGRTSVPQIFIGEVHVGGCDDLYALEEAGKLDPLLTQAGSVEAGRSDIPA